MVLNSKTFISTELATAPTYPDGNPPHLVCRRVQIDRLQFFEVWSPGVGEILSIDEARFLSADRLRVEVICSRLVRLLGASYSEEERSVTGSRKVIYEWESILDLVNRHGFRAKIIDVLFSPQVIRPLPTVTTERFTQWIFEPASWEIYFLDLHPEKNGYRAVLREEPLPILIWTGGQISRAIPSR